MTTAQNKNCRICGNEITRPPELQRRGRPSFYCSPACKQKAYRRDMTTKKCLACSKLLIGKQQKYCSKECNYLAYYDNTISGTPEQQFKARFRLYGHEKRCQDRGWDFDLTLSDLVVLLQQPCFYCLATEERMEIDRYNNDLGYTRANAVTACRRCNGFKSSWISGDEMLIVVKALGWRKSRQPAALPSKSHPSP